MSLKLSQFGEWVQGGDLIDYLEIRNGEQYVVPFTIKDNQSPPQPINLTGWTFSVDSDIYTATFNYDSAGNLQTITNFVDQSVTGNTANLIVTNINTTAGTGVLQIPATVNPNPSALVLADDNNTMLNKLTITATYPSSVAGFNSIRKLLIGLIVRIS